MNEKKAKKVDRILKFLYAILGISYVIIAFSYLLYSESNDAFFNFCTVGAFGFSMIVFSLSIKIDEKSRKQKVNIEEVNKISYIKYLYNENIIDDEDKKRMLDKCITKDTK